MECLNCGASGVRSFCPDCGQRHVPLAAYGLRAVFTDYTLQQVSKLKLLHALWALFREPGGLTQRFMQGQRKAQVNPLWMYAFVLSVTLALQRWLYPHLQSDTKRSITRGGPANVNVRLGDGIDQAFFESLLPLTQEITSYAAPLLALLAWFAAARLLFTRNTLSAGVFALHVCTAELLFVQPFKIVDTASDHWTAEVLGTLAPLSFGLFYSGLAFRTLYEDQFERPLLRAFGGWLLASVVFTLGFTVFVTLTLVVLIVATLGFDGLLG